MQEFSYNLLLVLGIGGAVAMPLKGFCYESESENARRLLVFLFVLD